MHAASRALAFSQYQAQPCLAAGPRCDIPALFANFRRHQAKSGGLYQGLCANGRLRPPSYENRRETGMILLCNCFAYLILRADKLYLT
jgi:hypothetical protein